MFPSATTALILLACALPSWMKPLNSASLVKPKFLFTTRINAGKTGRTNGVSHIIEADRARFAHVMGDATTRKAKASHGSSESNDVHQQRALHSINAMNAVVTYTVNVSVSDNATRTLLVDTGSSNTWIGYLVDYPYRDACYDLDAFEVQYGSGYVYGIECTETLTLSPDLIIKNQSIGVAWGRYGFDTDGILGLGPIALTSDTAPVEGTYIPTVPDNLLTQGTIQTEAIGIFYAPATDGSVVNGELTFGGADDSAYVGELSYTSLTKTSPADMYWGVDQTVSYGSTTIPNLTAGIVDTGTTLVYLPSDAYNAYVAATGAIYDSDTTLLAITEAQYAALKPLAFNIGTAGSYALSSNAQIWPRSLNTDIGGNASAIYLIVADVGPLTEGGLGFINGYTFLERFYTVYDTTNSRFGIAPTVFTNATTN